MPGGVTVIEPGKLVLVEPEKTEVTAVDVIELGEALIEQEGHTKGGSGGPGTGYSIHGAIGEAARRVTGATDKGSDRPRKLRDEAKLLVEQANPDKGNELEMNDNAANAAEAISLMENARRETV